MTLLVLLGCTLLALAGDREALLEADRAFDRATAERGLEGWVSFFAEDGMMFPEGRDMVKGKAAVRELMGPGFARPGFSLRWEPLGAEVARSGDLGYTWGHAVSTGRDKDGQAVTRYSKYVTIWRKQPDGSWKVAVDIGTSRPAPAGGSPPRRADGAARH